MIEASFDRLSRAAAISGAYQYDTGQRLRMHGLPSPDELLERDDLLSGELVTVQAHYSYEGDTQAASVLAQWDDWRGTWIADIPNEYLTRSEPVHVYVYVYYGEEAEEVMLLGETTTETRACTMYEGVFTPRSRPAPNDTVTDEQMEAWAAYVEEIDLALSSAQTAISSAGTATAGAQSAAEAARQAAKTAEDAAQTAEDAESALEAAGNRLAGTAYSVVDLPPGSTATVTYSETGVVYGIPQGETGEAGADGPTDLTIDFADGALTITPKEG